MRYLLLFLLIFHAPHAGAWVSGGTVGCQFSHPKMVCVDTSAFPLFTYAGMRVIGVVVHPEMVKPLKKAFKCLGERQALTALRTYHGAVNRRNIAGTNRRSKHWNGKAIDINAGIRQPQVVVDCFEQAGFIWGGRWSPPDKMHFELN